MPGNHRQHTAALLQQGAHGRGVFDVVILIVHPIQGLMREDQYRQRGVPQIFFQPFQLLRRDAGIDPGPERIFRGVHVVGPEIAGRVIGVQHDTVYAVRIPGIPGLPLGNAGIGDGAQKLIALQIIEIMIAEHMIGRPGKRGKQRFNLLQVGRRVRTGGQGVYKISQFDKERGFHVLHFIHKSFHFI